MRTRERTSRSVTHPQIAPGQARLTSEFFSNELPEKKLQLVGMSILSILLCPEPGSHTSEERDARSGNQGNTLQSLNLWKGMRHLRLVTNMRTQNDWWLTDYLLMIGNGTEKANQESKICLPVDICVSSTSDVAYVEKLIDHTFLALDHNMDNPDYMTS